MLCLWMMGNNRKRLEMMNMKILRLTGSLCSPVQGAWMENMCKRWHSCLRNELLIPLRGAPHACSGRRALSELRPTLLEALGIRLRATATARTARLFTNQGDASASRLETVPVLLRPVEPRKSEGPTGIEPHSGRCPIPRYQSWLQQSENISSGSLISLLPPPVYADHCAPGIKVLLRCVATLRQFRRWSEATLKIASVVAIVRLDANAESRY